MSLPIAIGVYFICWWLAFFVMLPIGVHTHADAGSAEEGMAESAPVTPHLLRKAIAATIVSAIVFAVAYAIIAYRLIPLDGIPMSL